MADLHLSMRSAIVADVDNLKSGSGTAEVDKSECILVFCTKAYFDKKNSMKELYRAVVNHRPILAMLEPDGTQDGGLDQAAVTALITDARLRHFKLPSKWMEWKQDGELLPQAFHQQAPTAADVVAALFHTPAVEWNRLPHFQDVTIRLIAQNGVLHSKPGCELYMQGEVARGTAKLPKPYWGRSFHLFCSEFNAGAEAIAKQLNASKIFTHGELLWTTDADLLTSSDHMLVLLDARTWRSRTTTPKLVKHIHQAMQLGVHLLCAHEFPSMVGEERHACEFGLMFSDGWTPAHLTSGDSNLYKEIALALKGGEWRRPGLVLLATKLAEGGTARKPITLLPEVVEAASVEEVTPANLTDEAMMVEPHGLPPPSGIVPGTDPTASLRLAHVGSLWC